MSKKSSHPNRRLFDYISGALDARARRAVENHLSKCGDCALISELFRSLKQGVLASDNASASQSSAGQSQISNLKSEISVAHPDTSELASFFYGRRSRSSSSVAAHVATCPSCAEEIAEYARAERAAGDFNPAQSVRAEVPAASWEMIREWEESSFAMPRLAGEAIGQELLDKLSELFGERDEQLRERTRHVTGQLSAAEVHIVPVVVIDRKGELRGVEMFEKIAGERGTSILKIAEDSDRFDNKPVHALLDFGEGSRLVISDRIHKGCARLQPAALNRKLRRANYFIIED